MARDGEAVRLLDILTWHVHRSYLWYLAQGPYGLVVPVMEGRPPCHVGLPPGRPVIEQIKRASNGR